MNRKSKRRVKIKNIVLLLLMLIFFVIFIISIIKIVKWKIDSNNTINQVKIIQKEVIIKENTNKEKEQIIDQKEEIPKENPYWDYIKINMIDVDFEKLKAINKEVVGWIQLGGTNINYPFVQAKNNSYYLTHSFNKSYNSGGWIFLDYRNNGTNNKNTIIYGHNQYDQTMFGSMKNVLTKSWQKSPNNYVIKVSTEKENTLWQIFSAYHIPTTNDYIQTNFGNDNEYSNFLNMLLERSQYNFNTTINSTDNILTLSTCYKKTDKMVVHAKLIKRETK